MVYIFAIIFGRYLGAFVGQKYLKPRIDKYRGFNARHQSGNTAIENFALALEPECDHISCKPRGQGFWLLLYHSGELLNGEKADF